MRRWLIAVVALAGCGKSKAKDCAARAHELAAWAGPVEREGAAAARTHNRHLVEARDAPLARDERAPIVSITRTGLELRGHPAASADELAQELLDEATLVEGHRVIFAIDGDAPMDEVAAAAAAAGRAGLTDAGFYFARPSTVTAPPASSVTARLEAIGRRAANDRATEVARVAEQVVASCPQINDGFARVAAADPAHKGEALVGAIEPGLTACGCDVDVDALRSTLWYVLGPGPRPLVTEIDVTLAPPDEAGAPLASGATWADAAPAVIAAAGHRVRFAPPAAAPAVPAAPAAPSAPAAP